MLFVKRPRQAAFLVTAFILQLVNHYFSYLNSAKNILAAYQGDEPFSSFLKKYFAANKKYGSKDRKQISHLCYCYFRTGKSLLPASPEERILAGLFLCSSQKNELLQVLKSEWNDNTGAGFEEKYSVINDQSSITNVFPWREELSDGINHEKFCESFFIQPDLFLRLRPGQESNLKQKLSDAGINYREINTSCLALSNASKVDNIIELNKEAVVQDYSSQRVGEMLHLVKWRPSDHTSGQVKAWDCCAASGGKSIMLYDIDPSIALTVSDIRVSIIANLKKRFQEAGISGYEFFVIDLTSKVNIQQAIINNQYSIIICDVPCSGSGTWSRTPEQLFYFDKKKMEQYAALQKKITSNVIPHVKAGGYLLYITCSVFRKENEEVVDYILQTGQLAVVQKSLLVGYEQKADTLFACLLRKL